MILIVGDPGHGGEDRHNVGYSKEYVEADGTLKISLAFEAAVNKYRDVSCSLTRYTDKTMSLTTRGRMASGATIFLSNHTNAASDKNVRGVEVFYSVDLPGDREIAAKLSAAIAFAFDIPDRGPKVKPGINDPSEDYFTVIDTAQDVGCPHVFLVEAMFHSNPDGEKMLLDDENLNRVGEIEAKVLGDHFGWQLGTDLKDCTPEAYAWILANKVSDGTRPQDYATREQVWQMLFNALAGSLTTRAIEALIDALKQSLEKEVK